MEADGPVKMNQADQLTRENGELRGRLARLREIGLRINESLDLETVLQGVLDSARVLTEARYGIIIILDDSGQIQDHLTSGMSAEDDRWLDHLPGGTEMLRYLTQISAPTRLRDFQGHMRSLGLPDFSPPMPVSPALSYLGAPVQHRGHRIGGIYLGEKEGGREFTEEDEETLVMFTSQAALVISNARRYREEQQTRTRLEALIDTSPVGVVVLDAKAGKAVSINRETRRILSCLHDPGQTAEDLLEVLSFRRENGQEIDLAEFLMTRALIAAETVRAEEVVIQVPDGRRVATLVNATPIHSEEGELESFVITLQDMAPLEDLDRLRAEFLGIVSHELRTPLASIKGSAASWETTPTAPSTS